jgi:NRAMP (natural resistance-associated macrophage protein)-like metal ion transporter
MAKKKNPNARDIEPGMVVEATKGDLGEEDVSKPKVADVVEDQNGEVKKLVVEKGVVFRKKLEIPADRIRSVKQTEDEKTPDKVTIEVSKEETRALTAVGPEELSPENKQNLLEEVEKNIPTAEGLRKMEAAHEVMDEGAEDHGLEQTVEKPGPWLPGENSQQATQEVGQQQGLQELQARPPKKLKGLLRILGPGLLAGMAGNDSSAVTAYSIDGATNGYAHLWLMLLSTPLYQSVQFACAKVGRITQQGLAEILREHYGRWVAVIAMLVLIIANLALIAADLVAIGSGLELITHISWVWFVVPVAAILWYLTVYRSFESIKKIFIAMSLVFVVYLITAIFSGAHWGEVLLRTFVPKIDFNFASISSAVALLGATISPYTMFWQVQGEKEEVRPGKRKQQLHLAALDIASGVISGNLVAYFIIVCTSATIFVHHGQINTAADAAKSLQPLLGPYAEYLFAIGWIGAGLIAIPVLLASTSYAVAGTFGWPGGLSKKPWQNEGFYLILTVALIISLGVALLRFQPVQLLFWANVLGGVLSPIMVIYVLLIGNNRKIMRGQHLGLLTNIGMILTFLVMAAAAMLLFYGLATGQAS